MMDKPYTPRLSQAVALVFLACASLIITSNFDNFIFGVGVTASIICVVLAFFVLGWITQREAVSYYAEVANVANALKELDQSRWQALGIRFPRLRIRWSGKPLAFLEDSDILMEDFEAFIRESSPRQICPRRNWGGGGVKARKWTAIFEWLKNNDYIHEYSASGTHSWLWRGEAYYVLASRYFPQGLSSVPELTEDIAPGVPSTSYN